MTRPSDDDVDRLYQVPLAEFVQARNALGKGAGARGTDVKRLAKPSLPAWAVNQLYWQQRPVYEDVIERAADLRATHAAASRGRATDIRGAGRAHEEAVERALKAAVGLLSAAGHPVTDATRQAIATTLRGLPGDEPHGRLTRPLEPRGFDALSAAAGTGRVRPASRPPPPVPAVARAAKGRAATSAEDDEAARTAASRAVEEAASVVREAEQVLRRSHFEAARTTREAERAERRLQQARAELEEAQAAVSEAERSATAAVQAREAAESRAKEADERLAAARDRESAAREDVRRLSRRRR